MRTFNVYRPNPPEGYLESGAAVDASKPQFQGVVFDDGTVAIRWFTVNGSTAIWPSLEDLMQIHGHPEYGTRWVWDDEPTGEQTDRPPLPTSREWLGSDGKYAPVYEKWCDIRNDDHGCWGETGHDGHHVSLSAGDYSVCGRWYDGGPFVEAK